MVNRFGRSNELWKIWEKYGKNDKKLEELLIENPNTNIDDIRYKYKHRDANLEIIDKYLSDYYLCIRINPEELLKNNINLTMDDLKILFNKYKFHIEYHCNFRPEFIFEHPNFDWDYKAISYNIYLKIDTILKLKNKLVFSILSEHVPVNYFLEHPELPWRYLDRLMPNIPVDLIRHLEGLNVEDTTIFWYYASRNCSFSDIIANLDLPWSFYFIRDVKNAMNFIKNNNKTWNWEYLSEHIPIDEIIKNPYLPWCYKTMSSNITITMNFIKSTSFYIFNWDSLSENPAITMNDIENNPDFPWNYEFISSNPNLTFVFLDKHSDKNWDYIRIFKNKFSTDSRIREMLTSSPQNLIDTYDDIKYRPNSKEYHLALQEFQSLI